MLNPKSNWICYKPDPKYPDPTGLVLNLWSGLIRLSDLIWIKNYKWKAIIRIRSYVPTRSDSEAMIWPNPIPIIWPDPKLLSNRIRMLSYDLTESGIRSYDLTGSGSESMILPGPKLWSDLIRIQSYYPTGSGSETLIWPVPDSKLWSEPIRTRSYNLTGSVSEAMI